VQAEGHAVGLQDEFQHERREPFSQALYIPSLPSSAFSSTCWAGLLGYLGHSSGSLLLCLGLACATLYNVDLGRHYMRVLCQWGARHGLQALYSWGSPSYRPVFLFVLTSYFCSGWFATLLRVSLKTRVPARHWWLTPVILPTQEADIRRIKLQSQPGQIVHETLSWKYPVQKKGLVKWLKW
jgi:hypothetical protein